MTDTAQAKPNPLVKTLLYNRAVLDVDRVQAELAARAIHALTGLKLTDLPHSTKG